MRRIGPFDPASIENMAIESPHFTICEVLRQIYRATDDREIKLKARLAVTMAKKMDNKLKSYGDGQEKPWFPADEAAAQIVEYLKRDT